MSPTTITLYDNERRNLPYSSSFQTPNMIILSFKISYTDYVIRYEVDAYWNLTYLIAKIKQVIKTAFRHIIDDDYDRHFCIIPTIQNNYVMIAEEGEPLENNNNISLLEKYNNRIFNLAFYVRIKEPLSIAETRNIDNNIDRYNVIRDNRYSIPIRSYINTISCCICLENRNNYFGVNGCRHEICVNCYETCLQTNNTRCPICRVGRVISI